MGTSSFPGAKAARGMAMHLHLVPRLRMSRVTPSSPYMPSWLAEGHLYHLTFVL